jgi:cyanuric acid amidohydrolase
VVTDSTTKSMGYSRGASALGVGLALGEVARADITDDVVCCRLDLSPGRASASSCVELMRSEIVVLGNSDRWASDLIIGHRVMRDAIDLPAALGALHDVGLAHRWVEADVHPRATRRR